MSKFENESYNYTERLAVLESLTAELQQRLLTVMHPEDGPFEDGTFEDSTFEDGPYRNVAVPRTVPEDSEDDEDDDRIAGAFDWGSSGRAPAAGARTRALMNRGRPGSRRPRRRRALARWRMLAVGAAAALIGVVAALVVTRGSGAGWPASVARVQAEIKQACSNPDVAAEPSGLNFACAKDTNRVLWVFALLTSGDNPSFVDQSTGRKGLEPVQPAQGGDIAWSLNLHHPYNPVNPVDSLAVAARAINNIISGATLTSSVGSALIEPGLESKAANCQRYTGSASLVTRAGYPAACASPVASASGQAALVSDVFQRWMDGTPSRIASEAGVLFANADNPGNPQVRAILASLPASGG
jgi:hypothetical protein